MRAFGTWAIFPQLREISLTIDLDASHYLHITGLCLFSYSCCKLAFVVVSVGLFVHTRLSTGRLSGSAWSPTQCRDFRPGSCLANNPVQKTTQRVPPIRSNREQFTPVSVDQSVPFNETHIATFSSFSINQSSRFIALNRVIHIQ